MMSDSMIDSVAPRISWLSSSLCLHLATTLVHSFWQASVIAGLFATIDLGLRRGSANIRYWAGVGSLALIVVCSATTFAVLSTANDVTVKAVISAGQLPHSASSVIPKSKDLLPAISPRQMTAADAKLPGEVPPRKNTSFANVAPWITAVYLCGLFAMLLRLLIAVATGWRTRWNASDVMDDRLCDIVRNTAERWAIRVAPIVAYCHRVSVPVITGAFRPVILIPPALMSGLTVAQVELILAHELAHLRRGDLLINWFQRIVESMFFFHPAVWYISHRVSFERECTCDDQVIASGYSAFDYAEALVLLAEACGSQAHGIHSAGLLAATGKRPSQLKHRLLRLLGQPKPFSNRPNVGGVAAAVLLFGIGLIGLLHPHEGRSSDNSETSREVNVVPVGEATPSVEIATPAPDPGGYERTGEAVFSSGITWFETEISKIVIEGNTTIPEATIIKHIKTRPGRSMKFEQVKGDVDALIRTRWFVSVEPLLRPCDVGTALVFRVTERPIVCRVEYKGLKKVKQKVFDVLTQLKPGSPFDVRSNHECARRIEEYYHGKGFAFATVELEKGNHRDDREVVFVISEGPKVHVTAVEFRETEIDSGDKAQGKSGGKIRVMKLSGGKYDPSTIENGLNGIRQYYHALGYLDVEVKEVVKSTEGELSSEIHYEISEGPRYQIGEIRFEGNNVLSEQELQCMISLRVGDDFNQRDIAQDVNRIRANYLGQGRLFSRVDAIPCLTKEKGVVDIALRIDEDRVYRIRNFEWRGELARSTIKHGIDRAEPAIEDERIDQVRHDRLQGLSERLEGDSKKKVTAPFPGPRSTPFEWPVKNAE